MAKPSDELAQARAALAAAIANSRLNVMDRLMIVERTLALVLRVLEGAKL